MSIGSLPGFRDFYPQEFAERDYLFGTWRAVARRYAFTEYDGPPLEALELYTRKSGEEIVGQLYNFEDKGGRAVALRPEMTPTLARMVAARANALRKPVRWFSIPQLFRYERPQKGRLREHYQLNVDIVGEGPPAPDAELLACGIDIMRALGLTQDDVVARISDRNLLSAYLAAVGVPAEAVESAYTVIDKLDRQPEQVSTDRLASLGIGQPAIEAVLRIPRVTFQDLGSTLSSGARPSPRAMEDYGLFERYLRYLDALGVGPYCRFDLSIVRGLAYYTGIVFELFDRRGEFRAICGGGRYDNLLASLGGPDLPALGFGMGDVVLTELLRARGLLRAPTVGLDYWVAGEDGVPLEDIMRKAAELRASNHSVEYSLRGQSLAKQLKAAKALGAREIIVLPAQPSHG
jgi:histidyl-tRNA synthetase